MSSASFDPNKYVKPNVSKDDVIQIKKTFDSIDTDHNNSISPLEIRAFFQRLQLEDSKDDIYSMLKEMDDDYSGGVDFEEFFAFLTAGIYDEKEKREEIRKLLKKGVELSNKEEKKPSAKKEETKTTEVSSKKPAGKEEKPKEAGASREKKKKELLRNKPKGPQGNKENKTETNEFDPEPYTNVYVSKDTVSDLKKAFDMLDEDGSGTIAPAEIMKYFEKMGLLQKNKLVYQLILEMDADGSGAIDFEEFLKFVTGRVNEKTPNLRDEIAKIFAFYDKNNNGKVSWNELKQVAQFLGEEMSDEELREMFTKADLDDDGFVTVDDFYNIWTGQNYY